MPNEAVLQQIEVAELIQSVDDGRAAALLTLITNQLATVNANQPLATGGTAQAATQARDLALDKLQTMNDPGAPGFFYCSASDDEDRTPELAKIGKQPRRDRGEAEPEPLPDAPGPATFDAATPGAPGSVAALPEHATSLRAFRQPLGGTAELAGTSTTTTVSVTAAGPLTPRRHLRILARRPQLPRRRPGE